MRSLLATVRDACGFDSVDKAEGSLAEAPTPGRRIMDPGPRTAPSAGDSIATLAATIKDELRLRFERGERPTIAEYLARFPALRDEGDRVVSLIYEEFCLLEEGGTSPDVSAFCARYPDWRDSLISQLGYHALLSQLANPGGGAHRFPEPGESFEEFRLETLLGAGGSGRVFLARDQSLGGRPVALKVSLDRGNEPSILGKLDHLHIMPVHSVVFQSESKLRGLCMPYRPGLPLDRVISRVHAMSEMPPRARAFLDVLAEATGATPAGFDHDTPGWDGFPTSGTFADGVAWVGATLARALAHAHESGILHRDVKPANVLLTRREGPQLLDFNLAHAPHSPGQAQAALQGGTLPYMAPEQLHAFLDPAGWDQVGARADLYSLGLLLREMLTGQVPELPDPTLPLPRAIGALLDLRAAVPVSFGRAVPAALAAIIGRCLAFEPASRYRDAQALAVDLECFLERRPLRHASNPSRRERLGNWAVRRHRWLAAGAVVVVVLGALLYAPLVRRLVPLEHRSQFLEAVSLVEHHRAPEARALLDRLETEAPDSPVLGFYLSLALLQENHPSACASRFARTVGLAGTDAALLTWGLHHPGVAEQFVEIGWDLLQRKTRDGTLPARAFRLALRLDPSNRQARLGLAITEELGNRFDTAHDQLTDLIRVQESEHTPAVDPVLSNCYRIRARVAPKCGDDRLRHGSDPVAAERLAHQALADNERWYGVLSPSARAAVAFQYGVPIVEAKLVLGDVALSRRAYTEALAFYRDAKALSNRIEPKTLEEAQDRSRRDQRLVRCIDDAAQALASFTATTPLVQVPGSTAQPGCHREDDEGVRCPGHGPERVGADQTSM